MTLAKGQGSSCRKGKEVTSDDLATWDVAEEAFHSKSKHFDKEEAWCDPDSECAPLIDRWYDAHAHFPKVPTEYTPPPLGRVWLTLYHRNPKISWALLASSISDLVICQGTSLPVPISLSLDRVLLRVGKNRWTPSYQIRALWRRFNGPMC